MRLLFDGLRVPIEVYFEVSYRCNLRCFHCYSDSSVQGVELQTNRIKKILEDLKKARVFVVHFGGGEPFVRSDIFDLLRYSSQNFATSIVTNGTLITPGKANLLRDLGIKVGVSLDGPEIIHDSIRGFNGTFRKTLKGINNLVDQEVSTSVISCVTNLSFDYLDEIREIVLETGVNSLKFTRFMPIGRARKYTKMDLRPSAYQRLMLNVKSMRERFGHRISIGVDENLHGLSLLELDGNETANCYAAKTACTITADGHLKPCPALTGYTSKDSLLSRDFCEIWRNSAELRKVRAVMPHQIEICRNCESLSQCGAGCRAASWAYFGHIYGPDPACWIHHGNNRPRKRFNDSEQGSMDALQVD